MPQVTKYQQGANFRYLDLLDGRFLVDEVFQGMAVGAHLRQEPLPARRASGVAHDLDGLRRHPPQPPPIVRFHRPATKDLVKDDGPRSLAHRL